MSENKISILIADDHTAVRKGLCALLAKQKYALQVVGEAGDGEEAVQKALQLEPDVILMDLSMPNKSGLEAIHDIRQARPRARILVLTSFSEDHLVAEAIRAGAYGYLLKDASPDQLVHTIRSVFAGNLILPGTLARVLLDGHHASNSAAASLTGRELEVLRCVSQGLTNKQIARELSIGATTVRTHVSSLMRKLAVHNRTQLAVYACEHGLL